MPRRRVSRSTEQAAQEIALGSANREDLRGGLPIRLAPEPMLKISDLVAILGVSRGTIYNIDWLWKRVVYVAPHSPRWHASDLRLYQQLRTGESRVIAK